MQQWQDLEDENGDPAEGVRDDDGEEAFGDGHLFFDVVAVLGGLSARSLDVIKHACIGENYDQEGHQVETCREILKYFETKIITKKQPSPEWAEYLHLLQSMQM